MRSVTPSHHPHHHHHRAFAPLTPPHNTSLNPVPHVHLYLPSYQLATSRTLHMFRPVMPALNPKLQGRSSGPQLGLPIAFQKRTADAGNKRPAPALEYPPSVGHISTQQRNSTAGPSFRLTTTAAAAPALVAALLLTLRLTSPQSRPLSDVLRTDTCSRALHPSVDAPPLGLSRR